MFDWILKHLFGSQWRQNLQAAFSIAAESYFAGQGGVTRQQVQAWMNDHITSIASDLAKANPVYAAMLAGAAEVFVPQLVDGAYDYVVEHALGDEAVKAAEGQASVQSGSANANGSGTGNGNGASAPIAAAGQTGNA